MRIKESLALATVSMAIMGAPATAATFNYRVVDFDQAIEDAGRVDEIKTTFNDTTDLFTWSSTLSANSTTGSLADSGWLVVNNGPIPRETTGEQVIFYLDAEKAQVSAYEYDGSRKGKSWQNPDTAFFGTRPLNVTNQGDQRTFSFDWDMTDINSAAEFGPQWAGAAFDEKIGIWFNAATNGNVEYDGAGRLSQFTVKRGERTFYDLGNLPTTSDEGAQSVPEPGMAIALGLTALFGASVAKRNSVDNS